MKEFLTDKNSVALVLSHCDDNAIPYDLVKIIWPYAYAEVINIIVSVNGYHQRKFAVNRDTKEVWEETQ